VDNASRTRPEAAIEAAQRADTLVYSVLFSDSRAYGGRSTDAQKRGRNVLHQLSNETGGSYFEFRTAASMRSIFKAIEQEMRCEYSLGYVSDRQDGGAGYRRIQVRARGEGLIVQARRGYYV
jgi:VWFA-related protein